MSGIELSDADIPFPSSKDLPEDLPVIHPPVSYDEFFRRFLATNVPCLLKGGCTDHWRSRKEWTKVSEESEFLNLSFFDGVVPRDLAVPVSNCHKKFFNAQEKCPDMTFQEYCNYWRARGSADQQEEEQLLYLKDWHFQRDCPEYQAYETPLWFRSDWLNEYWQESRQGRDDYRFVYVGPKGSWTPFHADVFGSFSWSANVVGRKRWLFVPPGVEKDLRNSRGQLPYDLTSDILKKTSKSYEIVQESGDIIFVPSLWHHQVHNLEDTISINHNWFNAANVTTIWSELRRALSDVQTEMQDCRSTCSALDWFSTCESLLRASHGMNVGDFLDLLCFVTERRRSALLDGRREIGMDGAAVGRRHLLLDVHSAKQVLATMTNDLEYQDEPGVWDQILDKIVSIQEVITALLFKCQGQSC